MTGPPDLHDLAGWVPEDFRRVVRGHQPEGGVSGEAWLRDLPRLAHECAETWGLHASGPLRRGTSAVVVPCRRDGASVALKITWPHPEAEHEHLALRAWAGNGAVRLVAADPSRWAMLLETLDPDRDLGSVDVDESSRVIGGLLRRLDRPALPQTPRLSRESVRWAERIRSDGPAVLPRRIVERASSLMLELGSTAGADDRLVHTDLHDANVLAAARAPWLAIDPKPLAAVPELAVAPSVWNRRAEAAAATSVRAHLRRRVDIACEAGGLDVELARHGTLARCALSAVWEAAERDPDRRWVSHLVTICKAMQD